MFDVSFVELMVIGIVALVVLGPERLPGAARTVGGVLRRARASWQSVRAEIERELAADELKRDMAAMKRSVDDVKASVDAATASVDAVGTFDAPHAGATPPAAPVEPDVPAVPSASAAPDERRDD